MRKNLWLMGLTVFSGLVSSYVLADSGMALRSLTREECRSARGNGGGCKYAVEELFCGEYPSCDKTGGSCQYCRRKGVDHQKRCITIETAGELLSCTETATEESCGGGDGPLYQGTCSEAGFCKDPIEILGYCPSSTVTTTDCPD